MPSETQARLHRPVSRHVIARIRRHPQRLGQLDPVAERLVGWTTASAAGRPLEEVLRFVAEHPDRVQANDLANRVLQDHRRTSIAGALLTPREGEGTWVDLTAAPIRDDEGSVSGLVVVFRNVSERRQAESAQRLLASIVENSQDAIYGKALDGAITSWNEGAARQQLLKLFEVVGLEDPWVSAQRRRLSAVLFG